MSAPPRGAGLQSLGVEPDVHVRPGRPAILEAFRLLRLWHNARQAGFLVDVRRGQVTRCITNAIFGSMCGKNWTRTEEEFVKRPSYSDSLNALEALVDRQTPFGRTLSQQWDPDETEGAIAIRFAAEAGRQGLSRDSDLCHFALRLAASPTKVLDDPLLDHRVGQLVDNPALFRGARFVSLLREHRGDPLAITPRATNRI